MNLKNKSRLIISILLSLVVGIVLGYLLSGKYGGRRFLFPSENKIGVVLDVVNEDYVDAINMRELTEKAIQNIIDELDPHSVYLSGKELAEMKEDMEGHFGGVGADFIIRSDTITIVNVVKGGPSEQAGLMRGDRVVTIDDSLFVGASLTEEGILKAVRGEINSIVKLGVLRYPSNKMLNFEIKRDAIPLTTVKAAYQVATGIGLIKIFDTFSQTTYKEFINAMARLKAVGCHSFILDLRMNRGGAMEAAVNIANEFLSRGSMIVYMEGKAFPKKETYATGSGSFQNGQLAVLMDQLSASASEIIAGAIQDNDRGLIIGRRSFGKGLVQNHIELSDGSALRLTIARYYTPSGRNIQRKYELGKMDEYNQDWINQLSNGEGFHEDSIKLDKSVEYHTVGGRPVYGGGGIMPDIFVPIDTSDITSYFIKLEKRGIFNQFAYDYCEENDAHLRLFKNYLALWDYLKTQPILTDIVRYAENKGIRRRSNLIAKSASQIQLTACAHIIRNYFGDDAFYPVVMSNDAVVKRAVEELLAGSD